MKQIKIIILVIFCLFVNSLFADVIYFSNGDIDEGHVKSNGDRFIISTKDMTGSYGIQTNKVMLVKYGEWLENLDEATQRVAENTKKTKALFGGNKAQKAINKITGILPDKVPTCIFGKSMSAQVIIIGSIFIFLSFVSLIYSIILLVDAFKCSLAWGLCSLFIPFVIWFYLFTNYTGSRGKMFFWLISPVVWGTLSLSVLMLTK
ncbi:MAG: hypothetical protein DRI44_03595 [Chlamydiae bacterium]|nr:MAG: hypothetical protein DRI44_03595 [Chlamydiota bacterium]